NVAYALGGVWQATIESSATIRSQSHGSHGDRSAPGVAAVSRLGQQNGSFRAAAIAGRAGSRAANPAQVHRSIATEGKVAELINVGWEFLQSVSSYAGPGHTTVS